MERGKGEKIGTTVIAYSIKYTNKRKKVVVTNKDALQIFMVIPSGKKEIPESVHGNHTQERIIIPYIPHFSFGSL